MIIGVGQLGSRHLQGLKSAKIKANIIAVDPSQESLEVAKIRYDQVKCDDLFPKSISFVSSIPKLDEMIDLCIVASNSRNRRKIIEELIGKNKIRYLILEKILFQKASDYEDMEKLLDENEIKTWVNCPMRMWPYWENLKKQFSKQQIVYNIYGTNYGLMCNAIHFVDFMAYVLESTDFTIETNFLEKKVYPSKREGFLELNGSLLIKFTNGSIGNFTCWDSRSERHFTSEMSDAKCHMLLDESISVARICDFTKSQKNIDDWKKETFTIPYQSQLTNILVEKILQSENCALPSFKESKIIHLNLYLPILKFLNELEEDKYLEIPFT